MRLRSLFLLSGFLFSLQAYAQDQPGRVEVFGGYSYSRYPIVQIYSGPWLYHDFNGWEASGTGRLTNHWGIEADFAGGFNSDYHGGDGSSLRSYMGGPRYSVHLGRAAVFGHALFGALTFNRGYPGVSATSFAFALGGGANLWLTRHWGVRLAQVDYLRNTNFAAATDASGGPQPSTDFRISTGLTVRF